MKRKLTLIFLGVLLLCGGVLAVFYPEPWYQMVDAGNQSLYNVRNISVNHNVTAQNFIGNHTGNITGTIISPVNWTNLQNYPAACPGSSAVTTLDDSVTCSDLWVDTAGDNMTGALSINNDSPLVMFTVKGNSFFEGNINATGTVSINANTSPFSVKFNVNGSSYLDGDVNVSGNVNITGLLSGGSNLTFGSNIDLMGFNIVNVTAYDLVEDDIPTLTSTWDYTMDADRLVGVDFLNNNITIKWANITDRATENVNFTNTAGYWNDTYATFNETYSNSLYYSRAAILNFGYYNSTDFSITDYYTKAETLNLAYYNSTDFSITDYYDKSDVLGFNHYNSSDFSITDYYDKSDILGFNHYNSSDFSISDYYTKADVLGFNHYNSSDFSISDYALNTSAAIQGLLGEGNITLQDNITFRNSEVIDNMDDGWLRLTGDVNFTGVLSAAANASPLSVNPFFIVNATAGRVGIGNASPIATLDLNGTLHMEDLEGTYSDGEAYVCVNDAGHIFASDDAC